MADNRDRDMTASDAFALMTAEMEIYSAAVQRAGDAMCDLLAEPEPWHWAVLDRPVVCECLCGHAIGVALDEILCPACEWADISGRMPHGRERWRDPLIRLLRGI